MKDAGASPTNPTESGQAHAFPEMCNLTFVPQETDSTWNSGAILDYWSASGYISGASLVFCI
jgi:hypothetical protein